METLWHITLSFRKNQMANLSFGIFLKSSVKNPPPAKMPAYNINRQAFTSNYYRIMEHASLILLPNTLRKTFGNYAPVIIAFFIFFATKMILYFYTVFVKKLKKRPAEKSKKRNQNGMITYPERSPNP
jgi:hypothetical protein